MNQINVKHIIDKALGALSGLNTDSSVYRGADAGTHALNKVLVANRGEIAKRFFLALHEEGIPSVAVVTDPDRGQSWYEFADEVVFIGDPSGYSDSATIIAAAIFSSANAIYSGYGFLSENSAFVELIGKVSEIIKREIIFMGPNHETMKLMGNKIRARALAAESGIPLFESSEKFSPDAREAARAAASRIGYPVLIKLVSGGGGKGMYPVFSESELFNAIESSCRIGKDLYNDGEFYLEKFIEKPVHVEVQVFNGTAIGIRKCAVQRRNQKIIEESGLSFLDRDTASELLKAAEAIASASGYDGCGAGTVEFLIDTTTGNFGFMEMNTRLQVEYAVTDQALDIDIAKWQILYFDGRASEIRGLAPLKDRMAEKNHSIECRIYAEDPENDYMPSPGIILEMDLPTFNGIRCDFGFGDGDHVLPMYDPMIGKLIAYGSTRAEAIIRLERALQELYINGVKTNIKQLLRIVRHGEFIRGDYTNNILNENEALSLNAGTAGGLSTGYMLPAIFGALSEYFRQVQISVQEYLTAVSLESMVNAEVIKKPPSSFMVSCYGKNYLVDFIQHSVDLIYCYLDCGFMGQLEIISINDRTDDMLLLFGSSAYRARVNRFSGQIEIRMKDSSNKIEYYRMSVSPEGAEGSDKSREILSPFQGNFVSFCNSPKPGDIIKAGDPILILSSMKMETVIQSPVSGRLTRLIEDGDLSRLQTGRTCDGRIIGRAVQEGELLAIIETENLDADTGSYKRINLIQKKPASGAGSVRDSIFLDNLPDRGIESAAECLDFILAGLKGYTLKQPALDRIIGHMRSIDSESPGEIPGRALDLMESYIQHYVNIRKLFSDSVGRRELSYQEELYQYILNRGKHGRAFTPEFESLISRIMESYSFSRPDPRPDLKSMIQGHVLLLLVWSNSFATENRNIILKFLELIFSQSRESLGKRSCLAQVLKNLYEGEQSEPDDSMMKYLKRKMADLFPNEAQDFFYSIEHPESAELRKRFPDYMASVEERIRLLCLESEERTSGDLVPDTVPPYVAEHIRKRIDMLGGSFAIERIQLFVDNIFVYRLARQERPDRIFIISFVDCYTTAGKKIERAVAETAAIARGYSAGGRYSGNIAEFIITGAYVSWPTDELDSGFIDYQSLKNICVSSAQFFSNEGLFRGIITADFRYPYASSVKNRSVFFYPDSDNFVFNILTQSDPANPFMKKGAGGLRDIKLYEKGKWPVDAWAQECFDCGTISEIKIETIDDDANPAASKIYEGKINSISAMFYMKDFRINGGSTGNREGLKYAAACYLAYLKDIPLYVWNDSAGANINEGIVSLNRGGQGFMLNALAAERVSYKRFLSYTDNCGDPALLKIFQLLDKRFSLRDAAGSSPERFNFVALGMGSSAGLDVYGSSQAVIQVLLDSPESYRVLTGSNIIKSVIGESISNYDIGGARVLGRWAGVIDLIAQDKAQLIQLIHLLHGLFSSGGDYANIRRINIKDKSSAGAASLSEDMIRRNVDGGFFMPFRCDYFGAESLLAGFARVGGRRAMIMGPRTDSGLWSAQSYVKEKEILRIAQRTGTPCVFIFGRRWHAPQERGDSGIQARRDFMTLLSKRKGMRFNIVTHPDGLKACDINSGADVVIFVEGSHEDRAGAKRHSTFRVKNMEEAFDIVHRIMRLADKASSQLATFECPVSAPVIPEDRTVPFDMMERVIEPVFDRRSFMEFYPDMKDSVTGPNLITGLATLNGMPVGVIADQPMVKGGAADAHGTEKFRIFTQFLNRNDIPLIMISNSSGFVPGSKQERYRIQSIGAESLDENVLGSIPVVSVTLNQNYGGRLIHAFNKFLRPGIVYLALKDAQMAVLGAGVAFDLLLGRKYERMISEGKISEAKELREAFIAQYIDKALSQNDAKTTGLVDWIIENISFLRENLIKGLALAEERAEVLKNCMSQ